MAESNPTQVILTDDGIKIIKAQNTADNAASQAINADSAALIAQSTANAAKSAADRTYDYANSEIAVQSAATAKAQSKADDAFSQAKTAIDNDKVTSKAVTDLKDGSKLTIADLENGLASKVSNSEYTSYKIQTANLIGSKVDNGDFSTYKTQTADLIAQKVATKDFSAYQATTAKAIDSKVESKAFESYKTQTADAISSKVSKKDANNVNLIPYSAMPEANNLQWSESGTGGTLIATTHAFYHSGADPLYELNTAGSNEVFAKSPRFKINANSTYTFQLKGFASSNVSSMDVYVLGRPNGSTSDYTVVQEIIKGAVLSMSALDYRTVTFTTGAIDEAYLRIDNNGSTNGKTSILGFTELKLEPGDTATPYVYGAEDSMIAQMADDINLRVTKNDLIDQINIQAGNTLISSSGQLTLSGKTIYFDTVNPVIIPSANITGELTGKKLIASIINGSTINGTVFNAGTQLNQYGNTSYPMTISPDGSLNSTTFKSIANETAALRSSLKDGIFRTNLRGMTPFATGKYSAADTALGAGQLALHEGYSTSQDANFTNNSLTSTGYVIVDASNGMTLHGDNQQITFNGTSADVTPKGIIITPYGNINPNGTQNIWYVGNGPTMKTASFGIDGSGTYNIQFNRSLDIGNFNINTYHTITSSDNGPIHFNRADGNPVDIYASTVHYDSLVKSSLLSVKKDVKKADTAYWAQLVNSIDLATYQYKSDDNTSHLRLSSIVDDVNDTKQWQLPDVFISRDENGKLNGVDDSVLLNATLATVQEQQKEIDQLNGHNMELEARLNKLEAKLNG
ncbi:phage tail protein [Pediococcus acidilactici]|uniref:phage tail protein n=1 Tax=Pediococcus acidilactici TaxID=1254 RepID=UPI00132A860D|nr:phage tail protein [Pediococcus acidilactici]KAF0336890.1 phage tail protein [Pediococcus acidilactici]KAF0348495.1 phage tail protein [Pediococcus acidilactici]KAF0462141.1 phage tail protein [Pediococcus acidilactici]KAF0503006.1 phage tail protein [Pediococcus acidilactici]KAF0512209.1 phage tail protein [Pediococcus acidilactici]